MQINIFYDFDRYEPAPKESTDTVRGKELLGKIFPGLEKAERTGTINLVDNVPDWAMRALAKKSNIDPTPGKILQLRLHNNLLASIGSDPNIGEEDKEFIKSYIESFAKKYPNDHINAFVEMYGLDATKIQVTLPNNTVKPLSEVLVSIQTQLQLDAMKLSKLKRK